MIEYSYESKTPGPGAEIAPEVLPYKPRIPESCREHFWDTIYGIYQSDEPDNAQVIATQISRLNDAVDKAKALRVEVPKQDGNDWAYAIAALLLLRDLLLMGWKMSLGSPTTIRLTRATPNDDIALEKSKVKSSMHYERMESLSPLSVRSFVDAMEHPSKGEKSIFTLMGDGQHLHRFAVQAASIPRSERFMFLQNKINPYLQLVEGDERDIYSQHRLIDIWRYFRLTWSTPYRPSPGRNLFYLVRDACQINHPIMGIACLSNTVLGLRCRDNYIGWTPEAIAARLIDAKDRAENEKDPSLYKSIVWEISDLLKKHLEVGLAAINIDGIATRNEVAYPSEEGIKVIEALAQEASEERNDYLRREASELFETDEWTEHPKIDAPQMMPRENRESSLALFKRKRASKLAVLLHAKLLCQYHNVFDNPIIGLPNLLWKDRNWQIESEIGRSALRHILLARKDSMIGSAIMEITVCGAVAPYNYLLGGKLVAMLLTSPQVVREYRERYGEHVSTIASQVAGREVRRDANLVYLGTSSLYAGKRDSTRFVESKWIAGKQVPNRSSGASQYNRINIPAEILGGHGEVKYQYLGLTNGYGVVHFASDTRQALEELDIIAQGARRVNSFFGEGTSPRLRKIRQGLSHLELDDRFLVHNQRRLVYGINLAHNSERYLMGEDDVPEFILQDADPKIATKRLAEYWIKRWLGGRVEHDKTIDNLASFDAKEHNISRLYDDQSGTGV